MEIEHEGDDTHLGDITQTEYRGGNVPANAILREMPSVDVTWNRDSSYVQLSIEAPRDWWDRFNDTYSQANSPDLHSYAVFSEVLDRREINHLIRTLRRARDAAYGADE